MAPKSQPHPSAITRRDFLRGATALAAGAAAAPAIGRAHAAPAHSPGDARALADPSRPRTAIIIGSGFGGCVAALRLGQAGYRTTVFERGRRWNTEGGEDAFPLLMKPDRRTAWFSDHPNINQLTRVTPIERYPGLIDRIHGQGADAVFGAGVGGGSLTFGTFSIQPRRREWDMIYPEAIEYDEMDSTWFPLARKETGVSPLPEDLLELPQWRGAKAWLETVADAGLETTRHHFAIDWDRVREELDGRRPPSVSVGEYVYGTNSGAKLSLDRSYLARAEATGNVEVVPMTEAIGIDELPDGRMQVTSKLIDDSGKELTRRTDVADVVVMAAGAFHSTALLAQMRAAGRLPKLSPMVGENVGTNGDFLVGQTLQRKDFGSKQGGPGVGVVFDEGPQGPYSLSWEGAPIPDFAGGFTTTHLMQVMTDERGSITADPNTGTATLVYPHPRANTEVDKKARAAALHFKYLAHDRHGFPQAGVPVWSQAADFGTACTWHLLGGLVMDGARAHGGAAGAADAQGRVHGYPGLLVVDGSLLPGSTGMVNPSLTITAVAERCMHKYLADAAKE
ncbi:GMC oxidoreductase [Corynebacterium hansenii]|uniref:Cholesterol oxidase n=1 Tax=Corynebacterium hansenii TaxID=394964 RepID=A0ABV7ZQV1_9CORY|nr:GMC oxidoreductase [Corynebacterium hansenii]WJZ00739.1 Cholesterol oxidase precursor [Corynebacterium hansenii]